MAVKKKLTIPEKVVELIKSKQDKQLKDFLNDQYPQDISEVIKALHDEDKIACFSLLELQLQAKVLAELDSTAQTEFLKNLGAEQFATIVAQMDIDDATDLIIRLPEAEKSSLLRALPDPIQLAHVQELIHYPSESAGGIMSTDFLRLRSDMTIHLALNFIRRQAAEYKATIYYLYVVDNSNKLVGVIGLRDLICAPPGDLVGNHMSTEVITCKVTDDQETVAKAISKYDLIVIPVIDEGDNLKGVVTIDDVVDILKEETTEDIYQGSGISDVFPSDELISGKVTYAVRARLPWLFITLIGEAIAAFVIASFDKTISSVPIAISFMPLLSGLSGNVGGQTATIIVRGLVTGDIELKNTIKHIFHELKIGVLLGSVCALLTGLIAWQQHSLPALGIVVAFALICSMILGVLLGTIFPIFLQFLKKDPATASSPVITTLLDILTFTFYLSVISIVIRHLR
ncbi:MAG: magnesium transporter [Candidatus Melainabacteria bacterium]|nr:magnesium transporter [Candidatus Melainabacteria bacterium]